MNEQVKQYREVFVRRISQSGATRLYFGDVIRIFDEVLTEFQTFLEVKPGAPTPREMTAVEIAELSKQLTEADAREAVSLDFKAAEALLQGMHSSRGKETTETVMPLDDTEPQPNADILASVAEHVKDLKEGKIKPPAEADIKNVKGLKIPTGAV